MKNNVLLISVVEKCCPDETRMKCQILEKLKANHFAEALRVANEGLELGKGTQRRLADGLDAHFVMKSQGSRVKMIIQVLRNCLGSAVYSFILAHCSGGGQYRSAPMT